MNNQEIWIMAGESSGDAYGARLATELRKMAPDLALRGMGSDAMRQARVEILVDSTDLGMVGFVEVVKHLPTFWKIFHHLLRLAKSARPACVVLIDYPGFNIRFAEKLHAAGIKVIYYVSPQVWAWGKKRIPRLARIVDKMLVIFPFEPDVFKHTALDVQFVGHPLIEMLAEERQPDLQREPNTVLLLPGSRGGEVGRLLTPMIRTATALHQRNPALRFVITASSGAMKEHIHRELEEMRQDGIALPPVEIVAGETRMWLQRATAGLAASGTVTVEAAILGLPLVVVYRLNPLTYWLARRLVKIPYFTMVNVVVGQLVFEEFLQAKVNPDVLVPALEAVLPGGSRRDFVTAGMQECVQALGGGRDICRNTALAVVQEIGERPEPS
jgi:lipid-A-disaccharide synthase